MSDAPTPERKFRKATRQEQRQIEFLLREKLVQTDDEGKLWAYRDGLDDEAIARMVAPDLSATAISRIRMEDYGTIRRPGADDAGALRSLAERVTVMLRRRWSNGCCRDGIGGTATMHSTDG